MPLSLERLGWSIFARLTAAVVGGILIVGAPSDAAACLTFVDRFQNSDAQYRHFARAMVREAYFIDVVEVLGATPIVDPLRWDTWLHAQEARRNAPVDWARQLHAASRAVPLGMRFNLKVVERLKAVGPMTFQIEGGKLWPATETFDSPDLEHVRDLHGHEAPFVFLEPQELAGGIITEGLSCHPPALTLRLGARYLMFRDRGGRLLGPVRFNGVDPPTPGYRLIEIGPGGPQRWLEAVRNAALAQPPK